MPKRPTWRCAFLANRRCKMPGVCIQDFKKAKNKGSLTMEGIFYQWNHRIILEFT